MKLTRLEKDHRHDILEGSNDEVTALATFPNNIWAISGSSDKILRLWNIKNSLQICSWSNHKAKILAVAVNSMGTRFASADIEGNLLLWDTQHLALIGTMVFQVQFMEFSSIYDNMLFSAVGNAISSLDIDTKKMESTALVSSPICGFEIFNSGSIIVWTKNCLWFQ